VDCDDSQPKLPREAMPALFGAADDGAVAGQTAFLWATRLRLIALSLVAVASTLSTVVVPRALLLVTAVAFVAAVALEVALWIGKPERRWYDGRAAAESLKTLAWRYSVKGEPFGSGLEDQSADDLFFRRTQEVLRGLRSVALSVGDHAPALQITPQMRALRQTDFEGRADAYNRERVQDQRSWYERKSRRNTRRATVWTAILVLLEFSGLVLVALEVSGILEVEVVAIVAVLGASLVAWIETRQFRQIAEAYFVASHELDVIRADIGRQDESSWGGFVDKAEEAISREHTLWRASRGHDRV
jgi:hypothetical protein